MLLGLPAEIILQISRHLSFKNKLALITTCQRLNDVISNATLYEDLDTIARKQDDETIITRFKNKEMDGSQVKTLLTFMQGLSEETFLQLPEIFPNVRKVMSYCDVDMGERYFYYRKYMDQIIWYYDENDYSIQYEANEKIFTENSECNWIQTLQIYDTAIDWCAIWSMLKQYTFPHLVELNISKYRSFQNRFRKGCFDGNETIDEFYLVPYFKNAPSLKRLTFYRSIMSLKLLDEIHASCPLIECLELEDVNFQTDSHSLSQPIVPANSVLYLKLQNMIDFDQAHSYLDYIPEKYPKLRYLYFDIKSSPSLYNGLFPNVLIRPRITKEVIQKEKARQDTKRLNRTRFISRLPKTITTLCIGLTNKDSLVDIAESGMNVRTLDISTTRSNVQCMHDLTPLRNMRELRSLKVEVTTCDETFNNEHTWDNITTLTLCYMDGCLYIDQLLSLFPSLADLDLTAEKGIASGDLEQLAGETYPNLKRLTIQDSEVHPSLFIFINHAVPNLEVLNMRC